MGKQRLIESQKSSTNCVGSEKCQNVANGRFCFGQSGSGSFNLGHPGGAFNGETWNPIGTGTAGGLLVGAIGSADDIAK